jgi:hypothetical protein
MWIGWLSSLTRFRLLVIIAQKEGKLAKMQIRSQTPNDKLTQERCKK